MNTGVFRHAGRPAAGVLLLPALAIACAAPAGTGAASGAFQPLPHSISSGGMQLRTPNSRR
ncbi:hypothetical protein [Nocardia sp. NPDC004860]|uniref:hypothetical protein n=1 Tax=Nocardia sp. NPDC004860 TaxID=3154557 RepID=UPI0033ACB3E9